MSGILKKVKEVKPSDEPQYREDISKHIDPVALGLVPKKAVIEGPAGRDEISVKRYLSDTGTDFVYPKGGKNRTRYVFGDTYKLKTPNWVIGLTIAALYAGGFFMVLGFFAPLLFMLGAVNLVGAVFIRVGGSTIKETYNLWFEGQSNPVPHMSHPCLTLPQLELDENGKPTGKILYFSGKTFDDAVTPHAFREIGSRFGPKITWDMMKWVMIIGVIGIVAFGVAHLAHLV